MVKLRNYAAVDDDIPRNIKLSVCMTHSCRLCSIDFSYYYLKYHLRGTVALFKALTCAEHWNYRLRRQSGWLPEIQHRSWSVKTQYLHWARHFLRSNTARWEYFSSTFIHFSFITNSFSFIFHKINKMVNKVTDMQMRAYEINMIQGYPQFMRLYVNKI